MRIRVDTGSDIRVAFADPGFGTATGRVKSTSVGVTPPPPPPDTDYTPLQTPASTGSFMFDGFAESNIFIPPSSDFVFPGAFTIEWWHNQTATASFPRIFSIGDYSGQLPLGVSIEGGTFYFWVNNSPYSLGTGGTPLSWSHHAVCRQTNGVVTHYLNGDSVGTFTASGPVGSSSVPLRLGNELTTSAGAAFPGLISNFHIIKGVAKYTGSFTPPTSPIPATTGTKMLLWAETPNNWLVDGSGSGRTVTANNLGQSSNSPYA
jgi:hypothetical protein